MTTTTAVLAEGLHKRYGDPRKGGVAALAGFDLAVATGTVCGLLGPNGAGKTTAVRVLATLLRCDRGRATVAGFDLNRQPDRVREAISLTGQYAAVDEILSGRQNLVMFARLARLSPKAAQRRADELLTRFQLTEAAARSVGKYSGGMRRRLDLAVSLIRTPQILFLDEPTTGLDPRSRNQLWDVVRELVRTGTTVLLTTQYLEEADQLADRIVVIDAGRTVAAGTPDELKAAIGGDRIEVTVRDVEAMPVAAAVLAAVSGADPEQDPDRRRLSAPVVDRMVALTRVLRGLSEAGVAVADLGIRRPTLDEAFLQLTGHRAEEVAEV